MLRRKNILYISESGNLGGAEISLLEIITALNKDYFNPFVVCSQDGPLLSRLKRLQIPAKVIPLYKIRQICFWKFLISVLDLIKFLKQTDIALVHTNSSRSNILGGFAGRIYRIPVIWHVRNLAAPGIYIDLEKYFTWLANVIIVNSIATGKRFGVVQKKLFVIYNGVDLDKFNFQIKGDAIRQEFNISSGRRIVAIVGRLGLGKGHDYFLQAVNLLKQQVRNVVYLIVGSAITEEESGIEQTLRTQAAQLGIDGDVIFTGFREDMPALMVSIDILVCPSSITGEPFGKVLAEAMACGKPVIVTNAGGAPEVIEHNVTGILVPMRDSASLAQAIKFLLEHETLARQMGQAGRIRVEKKFDLKQTTKQIENIYLNLLSAK